MKYKKPEMEIVFFEVQEVITSSTLVDTGQPGGGTGEDEIDFGSGFN